MYNEKNGTAPCACVYVCGGGGEGGEQSCVGVCVMRDWARVCVYV